MRSDNLQLTYNLQFPCVQLPTSYYILQIAYGRHGHHSRHDHHCPHGHGGRGGHGGQSGHGGYEQDRQERQN